MEQEKKKLTEHGTLYVKSDGQNQKQFVSKEEQLTHALSDTSFVENIDEKPSLQEQLDDENRRHHERLLELERLHQKQSELEEEEKLNRLIEKLNDEIAKEVSKNKRLISLENARKNALDSAYARYGNYADLRAIDAYYDGMAAMIDPKVEDLTDVLSMSLNNALHGSENVQMVMPNGSIRVMDAEVAELLVLVMKKNQGKVIKPEEELLQNPSLREQVELQVCVLQRYMEENANRQQTFHQVGSKACVNPEIYRLERMHQMGYPTKHVDYDDLYYTQMSNGDSLREARAEFKRRAKEQSFDFEK